MKLLSFQIHQYGPLAETPRIHLKDFNLFWGHNEDGKTLTLEAIVKLLLGKQTRHLEKDYQRVEGMPQGYVEVQLESGETLTFKGKKSICDVLNISPALFHNLFVVRNSDLVIPESSRFYGNVTEQLTHSRLSRMEKLRALALEKAQLTPSGDQLRNTADNRKLRDRYHKAATILKRIEELEHSAQEEHWAELTLQLAQAEARLEALAQEIEQLELAGRRAQLEQGEQLLEEYRTVRESLARLQAITPEKSQQWQAAETTVSRLSEEIAELQRRTEAVEQSLKEEQHHLDILQAEITSQQAVRQQLQNEFIPDEKQYEEYAQRVAYREGARRILAVLLGGSLLSVLISLFFTLRSQGGKPFIFLVVTLLIFVGVAAGYFIYLVRPAQKLKQLARRLISQATRAGLDGETVEQVRTAVHRFLQNLQQKENRFQERKARIAAEQQHLQEQQQLLAAKRNSLLEHKERLARLKQELDVVTLMELNQRLKEKTELEQRLAALRARLNQLFQLPEITADEHAWEEAIDTLEPYRHAGNGVTFDEHQLEVRRGEYRELQDTIAALKDTIQHMRTRLQEIEREARTVLLDTEEAVICQSVFDLKPLREKLMDFRRQVEKRMWLGKQLTAVLDDALQEEQARISDLFGEHSPVSGYFREITGGLYSAVQYNAENNRIQVVQKDGSVFTPEQLSGGTFDQLYFAIRVALAEKVMGGEKGFLLLDDPFIKADSQRLGVLLEVLFSLVRRGWQILYFSAKDEIRAALQDAIQSGEVTRIELPPPLYKTETTG